ncbi:MAG: lipopolysaccharide biosynthesis protein [Alphaproteobacteria bacterium]|nr:lipopolysaccharide biosynthesis protein [Alphaproteobacteria bacterium]
MTKDTDAGRRMIVQGSISTALGFGIRLGARLLFLWVAGRLFGVTLFGAFGLAVAVVELAVSAGGLGMKRMLFKLLDERPDDRPAIHIVLDCALLVAAASLLLAAIIMAIVGLAPALLQSGATGPALAIVAPMIAGQALLDLILAATRWQRKIRYEVTARSIVEPYAGLAVAVAAYASGFVAIGLPLSYWGGTLAALAYAVFGLRRSFGSFQLRDYRTSPGALIHAVRTTGAATFSDTINALFGRIDLYLVGALLGEAAAGIYGMARQGRTPIRQVRQSFDGLLTPLIARTLQADGAIATGAATASAARLILSIQLALLIALIGIGRQLLGWIGPEFAAGYVAMVLLALAEAIQSALGLTDLILLYRRPSLTLALTGAGIAINVAAAFALTPSLGIEGAAAAAVLANVATALLRRFMLHEGFGIRIPLRYNGGLFACAALGSVGVVAVARLLDPGLTSLVAALPLAAGLAVYAVMLKAWTRLAPGALSLAGFRAE